MSKASPQRAGLFRRVSAAVLRYVFVLVGLCRICAPAWAAGPSDTAVELHLLRPGIAGVADFDGDHIPDVASGTNLGRTEQGYNYRVDLDLTDNSQAKPFSVISNEPNGLD